MPRISILAICIFLLTLSVPAQKKATSFDAQTICVEWEIVENNYQGQGQFLSAFTFTNTGKKTVPATGWSMYFNIARAVKPGSVTGGMMISHINGDLYRLSPAAGFSGLLPKAALRVEFVSSDWAINATDAPLGLFWVYDADPATGRPVVQYFIKPSTTPKQYLRSPSDKIHFTTPADVYQQNKNIRDIPAEQLPKIFPAPLEYRQTNGELVLNDAVSIVYDEAFLSEANYLADELAWLFGKRPAITSNAAAGPSIVLQKNNAAHEAYELSVKPTHITITAGDGAGIFYGIQSLKSLLPATAWAGVATSVPVPAVEVKDAPRFGYRAFMLDVGRNFQTKAQLLKTLDLLSLYKLNVFHFHFCEDEGWRIEMPSLPELTSIGAKRGYPIDESKQLIPSFGSGPDAAHSRGSGFYSKADFIEILRYANARHIRVIPEIETPGHARAAVISMKARYERLMKEGKDSAARQYMLHDPADQSVYRSVQGWRDNVMNVALPSTYRFLERVVDDLRAMYQEAGAPLMMIHVGGDEVPAGVWERSPACEELIKNDPAIKNTDDLWYYYYGKVNDLLKVRGLSLYGWEEAGMRKTMLDGNRHNIPNPDFVKDRFLLDVWNNVLGWGAEDLAYRLANAGYPVVLSPVSNLYFDMAYNKSFDEPGYYWGGYSDLEKPWYYIPFDYYRNSKTDRMGNALSPTLFQGKDRLTDYGKEQIAGIQGLLWSETILSEKNMEYMLLPKLLGLAERAWASDPAWTTEKEAAKTEALYTAAWSQFVNVVGKKELPRLDHYAGGFQYRIPPAGVVVNNGQVIANIQLPGLQIRYTTDGTEPVAQSKLYTAPVTDKGTIKFKVFNSRGRSSKTVEVMNQ